MLNNRLYLRALILILIVFTSGCTSTTWEYQPPDMGKFSSSFSSFKNRGGKKTGDYRVKRGDTLYSIAWVNNLDYRTLAQINQLSPPYRIYAGQYLRTKLGFFESIQFVFKRKTPEKTSLAKKNTPSQKRVSYKKTSEVSRHEVFKPKKPLVSKTQYAASPVVQFKKGVPVKGWTWPSDGKIVQGYSEKPGGNKGIDITGQYGAPIKAAAKGVVVYSGSGLKGYGQLLLIKHNNSYLSAYAHNKRLLVKEGESVAAGQQIAEMAGESWLSEVAL